jgi:PAS domain S-box-containing protein
MVLLIVNCNSNETEMKDKYKTKAQLGQEISELRRRLVELEVAGETRKLMEEELKSSHEYLRKLNDSLQEVIFTVRIPERIIICVNQSVVPVFGYEPEECLGRSTEFLYPTVEEYHGFGDELNDAIDEGKDALHTEHLLRRRNGEVFPGEIATIFFQEDGRITQCISILRDTTERQRAEEELRALSNRLVQLQEEERRAISRELHDQIGQSLTVLKLLLDKAGRLPAKDIGSSLDEAQALLNELMGQVRDLSLDLRPAMLDNLGLLPALLWHFDRYATKSGVRVNFKHAGLERHFPPETSVAAYRIVQEALTNVMRHAGVNEVAIRASVEQNTLCLLIEDKGTGFDLTRLPVGISSGLYGMQERARALGGKLAVQSTPGVGTIIKAELPLSDSRQGATAEDKYDHHSASR